MLCLPRGTQFGLLPKGRQVDLQIPAILRIELWPDERLTSWRYPSFGSKTAVNEEFRRFGGVRRDRGLMSQSQWCWQSGGTTLWTAWGEANSLHWLTPASAAYP